MYAGVTHELSTFPFNNNYNDYINMIIKMHPYVAIAPKRVCCIIIIV